MQATQSQTKEDSFPFNELLPELQIEVIKYLDIKALGRFIQIHRLAESTLDKNIWKRKIDELDPTIWPQLSKRTRKGDLKLLCAIVYEGSIWCGCPIGAPDRLGLYNFRLLYGDFLLQLQKIYPSLPAQNAFLCYLFTYAKHGSVGPRRLNKNIGMKCGDVFISHGRILGWLSSNVRFIKSGILWRHFLHQFARVTYSWSVRWKMAPLFINNREAFSEGYIKLFDQDSKPIEFNPVMRHKSTLGSRRERRDTKTSPLKIDNAKTKFYSIEQIRKNKFKIMLDGEELTPNDLYYFFDFLFSYHKNAPCRRLGRVPIVVRNWLMAKQDRADDHYWP